MNEKLNTILDGYKGEMTATLQELLRIKSITGQGPEGDSPFGKTLQDALDYCLELGRKKGFECVNFDNYAAELNFGEGTDSVGVMSHLDVVPEGEGWNFPPYDGILHDGNIYGRGAVDDKGCFVAAFYACLAIKDSGLPLSKRIKQIIGTNEETGTFPCMQYYKKVAEIPSCGIVPDSWFPAAFAEKGIVTYGFRKKCETEDSGDLLLLSATGGEAVNVVAPFATAVFRGTTSALAGLQAVVKPFAEKGLASLELHEEVAKLTTIGKSAHASTPEEGINAIGLLLQILEKLTFAPAAVSTSLHALARMAGHDTDGAGMGIKKEDHTGPLTNNIGLLSYEKDWLELKFNIRFPITYLIEDLEAQLMKDAGLAGMEYERISHNPHFYVEPDSPLVQTLVGVYQEMTGDTKSQPKTHGGGSYARIFENFIPFGPSFQDEPLVFHKQDEHISCDRLLLLSKIYAQALYQLSK